MRAGAPAVDPGERDPATLTFENAPTRRCQNELDRGYVATRGRTHLRHLGAAGRLDEPRFPAAELPQRAKDPRITVEGRILELLRGEEGPDERMGAAGKHLQQLALGAREAAPDVRQFLEETRQRGGEERQAVDRRGSAPRECTRVFGANVLPDRPHVGEERRPDRHSLWPQRLELVGRELAEAAKAGTAGERPDLDELERVVTNAGATNEREHVNELQLVVQVVLEPEDDRPACAERAHELVLAGAKRRHERGL